MNVMEFFELCAGEWISQRTSQLLAQQSSEASSSRLEIITLAASDPAVIELCQRHRVDPSLALTASRVQWKGEPPHEKAKGETVLVLIPNNADPCNGRVLRDAGATNLVAVGGTYAMGLDDALTLQLIDETTIAEERIWFASPNLRLRATMVQQAGEFTVTTFCSEIRRIPTPSTAPAPAATAQQR
jgi:phycoerythrin-associated linker protein